MTIEVMCSQTEKITVNPAKFDAVTRWSRLTTVTESCSLWGCMEKLRMPEKKKKKKKKKKRNPSAMVQEDGSIFNFVSIRLF